MSRVHVPRPTVTADDVQHEGSRGKKPSEVFPASLYFRDAVNVADFWRVAAERFKHRDCVGYRVVEAEEDEV